MAKPTLKIENVGMVFPTKRGPFVALRDIHLEVARGETVSLIGHSGCGKSTLLNLVAGLTTPTSGMLLLEDRELKGPGPDRGVVFQNHSLLPWLSCLDNVHLAVERVFGARENKAQLKERSLAALCTAAAEATPETLQRPHGVPFLAGTPIETVGHVAALLLTAHLAFHSGQLSLARRQLGFAPLF